MIPIEEEAGWALKSACTVAAKIRTSDRPACSLVAVPTILK
jgi:hypothetical protein